MYRNIYTDNLKNTTDYNIIDIRNNEDFQKGHIPNAINIPFYQLINNYSKILKKGNEYYIYCQRGTKSKVICNILDNKGYSIINIVDGYKGWIN